MRSWLVLLVSLPLLVPLPAQASVHIGVATYPTIADAITNAVAGDTLILDPGVYLEHVIVDKTLSITGGGAATLQYDGAGTAVIEVALFEALTLTGVTVTSVSVRGIDAPGQNTLTVVNTTFQTEAAGAGGGISAADTLGLTLTDVTFDGTTAGTNGGGLYMDASGLSPVTLTDVSFLATAAGLASDGGGLRVSFADLTCTRCTFDGTSAQDGGGVYDVGNSDLTFVESTFTATSASVTGGAIRVGSSSAATVTDSTFTGTSSFSGGALYSTSFVDVSGALFCNTSATGASGGAIYGTAGGTVKNSRFVGTSATSGAAVYALTAGTWTIQNDSVLDAVGDAFTFTGVGVTGDLRNTAITGTTGFGVNVNGGAGLFPFEYNLYDQNSSGNFIGAASAFNVLAAPDYVAYSADGDCDNDQLWPTPTSPLLDAGDGSMLDPDGSVVDIGAYGGLGADPLIHGDADGDGSIFLLDCDDDDDTRYPGADELCDLADNDCDSDVDETPVDIDNWYPDCDGDGQGATGLGVTQCFDPAVGCPWLSEAALGDDAWSDCDDADDTVYYGAAEHCAAGDQNCDGDDDLGAVEALDLYLDLDGDGYGDVYDPLCGAAPQHVAVGGDCDDGDITSFPSAVDGCGDGVDQDCNGYDGDDAALDDWYPDDDDDGFGDPQRVPITACGDLSATHTLLADATDCDDTDDTVNPDGVELCNDLDDDCNGVFDDTSGPDQTWYEDLDGDGFGNALVDVVDDCAPDGPWLTTGGDCDDGDDRIHPDAAEICNDRDDDCDGLLDADDPDTTDLVGAWGDFDGDGFGSCDREPPGCDPTPICPGDLGDGWADNDGDCNDVAAGIHPGAEEVPGNTVDEDCDGVAVGPDGDGPVEDPGCNCATGDGPGGLLVLLLTLLVRRRR